MIVLSCSLTVWSDGMNPDCADTSIIRTRSRQELLYTRSQIAITAKAFGLGAVDMVRSECCGRGTNPTTRPFS